jgi:hypothetical protein
MLMAGGSRGESLQMQFAHDLLPSALSRLKLALMHVLASEAGSCHSDAADDQPEQEVVEVHSGARLRKIQLQGRVLRVCEAPEACFSR